MGMFFENYHIKMCDGVSQEKIKKAIESAFAKQGYVSCEDESATKSLVLRTSETGNWTSMIFAEENEGEVDREFCSNVFLKLVEQMDAYGLVVNCVDSDFAMLRLVSIDEDIDSAITIGDSYTGEVTEKEALRDWESVVDTEKLYEVCCGDYTFAEEGLEKAAELLGLDKNQVFLTEDDTSDESLTTLYFKKKNQRRKSFKTLFLEIFEEGLKDEGFVRVKGKYPYLARMVGDEIFQVITYEKVSSFLQNVKKEKELKAFDVLGTVGTVYRKQINLDKSPKMNREWLFSLEEFYVRTNPQNINPDIKREIYSFLYSEDEVMVESIRFALEMTKKYMVKKMDSVNSLYLCSELHEQLNSQFFYFPEYDYRKKSYIQGENGDGLSYYKIVKDGYVPYESEISLKTRISLSNDTSEQFIKRVTQDYEEFYEEERKRILRVVNEEETSKYTEELMCKRKANNLIKLYQYGLEER